MGRIVFSFLALGGFVAGLLAGGVLGAYLALSGTPEPAPSPARFTPMLEKPAAGLNPTVPLPVHAEKALLSPATRMN